MHLDAPRHAADHPATMSDATGHAALEVEQRNQPPRRIALDGATVRIGRANDAHLHVPDGHVSKQHAEIRYENGHFVAADVGSRAGVLVNGQRIERHQLVEGDVIELGDSSPVRLTFRAAVLKKIRSPESTLTGGVADPGLGGMARLARFFEFSRKLGGGFSLTEVLQDVVDLAIEVTSAERGMLILRRDDDSLETQVARGKSGTALPIGGLKVSETLVRKALTSNQPCVIDDVNQDVDLQFAASIVSLELRSAVTLPLVRFEVKAGHETSVRTVFGVLYLDSRRRRGGFDGFDLGILERLAKDASAVIENARLLREAEEKRRIDQEVKMAREVQEALMPEQFRSTPSFEVAGTCVPCHELGGDYVDQFDLGQGRQALVVADVCGKGIAASLLAASLQGALAAEISQDRPLGEVIARVNKVHCRLAPVGKFITLAVAMLEADGSVCIVNAGHCPILHVHAGGITSVVTDGMALGLDDAAQYREARIRMQPGDTVVLYTDGVIECEGPDRALFGDERLARVLRDQRTAPATTLVASVTQELDSFRCGLPVTDDLTVLVVRRR